LNASAIPIEIKPHHPDQLHSLLARDLVNGDDLRILRKGVATDHAPDGLGSEAGALALEEELVEPRPPDAYGRQHPSLPRS
jgi:hypothetical protein